MENHPIPQDITGFQFKLIGNMTVKQFAYLAGGTVIAWFIFFILPIFILIRLPLAVLFLSLGVALAFVPIDGRPMDTMIGNFIRALFSPTQYIYRKTGGNLSQMNPSAPQTPLNPVLQSTPPQLNTPAPLPPTNMPLQTQIQTPTPINYQQPIQQTPIQTQTQIIQPVPAPQPQSAPQINTPITQVPGRIIELNDPNNKPIMSGNLDDLEKIKEEEEEEKIEENERKLEEQVSTLQKELVEAKAIENNSTPQLNTITHQKSEELEQMLIETNRQKEALEKELLSLKARLEGTEKTKFNPITAQPLPQTQRARKVPPALVKSVGLPTAPADPNLITGIIKDPRGNPLPNILVEVKDPEDNPVRAFKTNGLGQFASATSLQNGKYIVSIEDPKGQNKFDTVEIEANGTPIMPLEIFSVDPREELRRELFN